MLPSNTIQQIQKLLVEGLAQRKIAKKLGVSRDTVGRVAKGERVDNEYVGPKIFNPQLYKLKQQKPKVVVDKRKKEKEFRQRLRANGICVSCAKNITEPKRMQCKACLRKRADFQKKRREKLRAEGLCVKCESPSKTYLCDKCNEYKKIYYKHYNKHKRPHKTKVREVVVKQPVKKGKHRCPECGHLVKMPCRLCKVRKHVQQSKKTNNQSESLQSMSQSMSN